MGTAKSGMDTRETALNKRAESDLAQAKPQSRLGTFLGMSKHGIGFGIGYSFLGVLVTCASFRAFHAISMDTVAPALLYLGVAAAGLGALLKKRPRAHPLPASGWNRSLDVQIRAVGFGSGSLKAGAAGPEMAEGSDAALLGHEIKNYLCTLKGNARLLRQRGASGDHSQILDRIDHAVEKMEVFVQDLGSASAAPRKPSQTTPAMKASVRLPVRLADVARDCVSHHFHADPQGFRFDIHDESLGLLGDRDRLEQVFLNLYVNAVEAGALHVETCLRHEGERLILQIEDDGMGCDPEDLERIFEPFFSTKAGPARRGLGMFIVQSIVESHGGKIRVHSKNNPGLSAHGLIFTLDFPQLKTLPARVPYIDPAPEDLVAANRWVMALPQPF